MRKTQAIRCRGRSRNTWAALSVLALASALAGCGLHPVHLRDTVALQSIPRLDLSTGPVIRGQDNCMSMRETIAIHVESETFCLEYDRLLWAFTKLPFVAGSSSVGKGYPILIDTGLGDLARVTLDVTAAESIPSHLGSPSFAFVDSLPVGELELRRLPAIIEDIAWQVRLAWLPVYQLSGWTLGTPILRHFAYLSFDGRQRKLTFSREAAFQPVDGDRWSRFPLEVKQNWTWATLPIAGEPIRVMFDSGGGPHIILNENDWKLIATRVKARPLGGGAYPTWGGFQPIDRYAVEDFVIGPISLNREVIWVRRDSDMPSTIGLGPFADTTVVYDFKNELILIKQP